MASPTLAKVGEGRLAGAIARLLRWEARLLARPDHDAASRSAALRGLEWAADFARALDAEPCAEWLDALRERATERPGHTPRVWRELGAPACAEVAAQLEEHLTLAPIAAAARPWRSMAEAVRGFDEPPAAAPEPLVATETDPGPEDPEAGGVDLSTAPYRCGERIRLPEGTRVAGSPALLREFALALAEWVGPYGVHADARNGRIELSGARPGDHAEPGRLSDEVFASLRALHQATSRLAVPLVVGDPEAGAVRWSVRLPAADDPRRLFAEAGSRRLALPWHAVVTYGLGEGGRSHAVLGRGLERIAIALDWLHGLGPARRLDVAIPEAVEFDTPALAALPHLVESEDGGQFVEVALLPAVETAPRPAGPAAPPPPAAAEPEAPPVPAAAPMVAPTPATADSVEKPAPPADNPQRSLLVALVADDSFTARVFLRRLLALWNIAVDEAEDGAAARAALGARRYDLLFLDADMPGGGALAIAGTLDAELRGRVVVLVRDDAERAVAQAAGFAHALYKPFAEDEVAAALMALAEESRPGA